MAAKSEKGPLETCLVVCTFGSYSLHENWMLPSALLHLSSFVFVLLLGPLRLREQVVKLGLWFPKSRWNRLWKGLVLCSKITLTLLSSFPEELTVSRCRLCAEIVLGKQRLWARLGHIVVKASDDDAGRDLGFCLPMPGAPGAAGGSGMAQETSPTSPQQTHLGAAVTVAWLWHLEDISRHQMEGQSSVSHHASSWQQRLC